MTCLLDTHFLLWILSKSRRLREYRWLEDYQPWGGSPISLLEIQLLAESRKRRLEPGFMEAVMTDPRFEFDEVSLVPLIQKSLLVSWTRDPFDRLISAHSLARRIPLCSVDSAILQHHKLVIPELK